ncbi:uncharacterized protein HKW66_Vig0246830 [Vigna angularis]|uniref:Uncharacterized protein n=1 Tax=Phaseolus angularis TaxID=3914 RepID=A0A8T0KSV2_PHAAN|nr:uncharacterized protein HKW66_Vig0246830 [Vigna angularis]
MSEKEIMNMMDGHIKLDSPKVKNRQKANTKYPQDKKSKQRKTYIVWENSDDDSSSDDDCSVKEETNLCFIAGFAHSDDSDNDFESEPIEVNYALLLDAF